MASLTLKMKVVACPSHLTRVQCLVIVSTKMSAFPWVARSVSFQPSALRATLCLPGARRHLWIHPAAPPVTSSSSPVSWGLFCITLWFFTKMVHVVDHHSHKFSAFYRHMLVTNSIRNVSEMITCSVPETLNFTKCCCLF